MKLTERGGHGMNRKGLRGDGCILTIGPCNTPHKKEHARIALGTTVGLSVPIYQPCYLLQTPVTPGDQTGAAMLSLVIRDVSRNRHSPAGRGKQVGKHDGSDW